jgi:hydrogenase nickel incorporation protein HypA/HybF
MHEGNYTGRIVATILEELKKHPGRKPKSAKVLVGEMLHLMPESVKMHFELLTSGTALAGVVLNLAEVAVRVRCSRCAKEVEVHDHHELVCSACGSDEVELAGGDQVIVESIEF